MQVCQLLADIMLRVCNTQALDLVDGSMVTRRLQYTAPRQNTESTFLYITALLSRQHMPLSSIDPLHVVAASVHNEAAANHSSNCQKLFLTDDQ